MKITLARLLAVALLLPLGACTMHRIDIQQGNIITPEMIQELKLGMSKAQVQFIMGTPLIIDVFNDNRWVYLYSMQPGKGPGEKRHLIVEFDEDKVVNLEGIDLSTPQRGDTLQAPGTRL